MTDIMKNPNVIIFENPHRLAAFFLKEWTQLASQFVEQYSRFSCAFSGGRTPVQFYNLLSSYEEFRSWNKVHIFMTDERFVEQTDKENNFRLINDNLLRHVSIPKENIHPIPTDVQTVGMAAEEYKNSLVKYFTLDQNHLPIIDLVVLGIGEDGHTASLFPDTEGINDPYRLTMPVANNQLKYERISITMPVINNARHVYFMVTGAQKAQIVKEIIENKKNYPASLVQPTNGDLTFLLDAQAAHLLKDQAKFIYSDQTISLNQE